MLLKEGTHKVQLGAEKKLSNMEDDERVGLDVQVKTTITLCLSDEILYNVINGETNAGLWCNVTP